MMPVAVRLRRNVTWSLVAAIARLGANAVLFIMVARFYGPEIFGQFTAAHTFATIFGMFADFGFDMLMTTEIARSREEVPRMLPRMLAVKLVLSVAAMLLMCAYGSTYASSRGTRDLTLVFSLYLFFSALLSFFFALFKGFEELQHEMIITVVINVVLIGTLVFLGVFGASVFIVAAAFIGTRMFGLLLAALRGKRFVSALHPVWDAGWFRAKLKQASIFGLFFVFGNLFFTVDTILISQWEGDFQVGIYQAVFRIAALVLIACDISVGVLLATLSRCFVEDRNLWSLLGTLAARTLLYLGLLLAFVMIVAAEPIIAILYGIEKFGQAVPVFRIFGLIICIRYAVEIPALMLTTSQQQHVRMVLVIGATVLNVALNTYAIPNYGISGAAWVSLATNVAVGIGYVLSARRVFALSWLTVERLVPLVVVLIGGALLVKSTALWLAVGVLTVAMVYCGTVWFLGYSKAEREMLRRAVLGGLLK